MKAMKSYLYNMLNHKDGIQFRNYFPLARVQTTRNEGKIVIRHAVIYIYSIFNRVIGESMIELFPENSDSFKKIRL